MILCYFVFTLKIGDGSLPSSASAIGLCTVGKLTLDSCLVLLLPLTVSGSVAAAAVAVGVAVAVTVAAMVVDCCLWSGYQVSYSDQYHDVTRIY